MHSNPQLTESQRDALRRAITNHENRRVPEEVWRGDAWAAKAWDISASREALAGQMACFNALSDERRNALLRH